MLNYNAQRDDRIVELERLVVHQTTMIVSLCGCLGTLEDALSGLVSGAPSISIHSPILRILRPASADKLTLGARAPGNGWEHVRNIERTGTIYLPCSHLAHFRHMCDVPGTFSIHVTTNPRLGTFHMYFAMFLTLSLTNNQSSHFHPSLNVSTMYPHIPCGLHLFLAYIASCSVSCSRWL